MKGTNWVKLVDLDTDVIWSGAIIRARLSYLDEVADFLVFSPNEKGYGEGLVYVTGYHAGTIYLILPADSLPKDKKGVSRNWLIQNWTKSVDVKGDVNKVYVAERYANPSMPNSPGGARGRRTNGKRGTNNKKSKPVS